MSKKKIEKKTPPSQNAPRRANAPALAIYSLSSRSRWVWGLGIAVFGFLLFANTLGHQYALDDYSVIKDNYIVQGGLKNTGVIFSTEYRYGYKAWNSVGSLYRPATLTMLAALWQISPDNPLLYHFTNVLFFALSGLLLWMTWTRILQHYPPILPILAILIFIAHPAHVEVVANIKSLDEIMSFFFCTLALWFFWHYFQNSRKYHLLLSLFLYGIALFFKESAITFVAIFPLVIYFFRDEKLSKIIKVSALMLIPAAVFLLARHNVLSDQPVAEKISVLDNIVVGAPDRSGQIASALMMCMQYLKTLIFPHPLISDMGYPQKQAVGWGHPMALLGLLVYFGAGIWALTRLKKRDFLAFAVLFFLITFSLFSNVFMLIGTSYGERLLYVPTLGYAFFLVWGLMKLLKINDFRQLVPQPNGTLLLGLTGVYLIFLSFKTVQRNRVWYDSFSLYKADIVRSPNCAKLNFHIGLEYAKAGMDEKEGKVTQPQSIQKAIEHYTKAIELYKDYHEAYGSRGVSYFRLEQYDKALADYEVALKYNPRDAKVLSNLGYIYFMRNDFAKAEELYRKSVDSDPRFVDARRNLGTMFALTKRFPEAIEQWKVALDIEPNNPTLLSYIGSAYKDMRKPDEAMPWLEKALRADPTFLNTLNSLAEVYVLKNDFAKAIDYYKRIFEVQPGNFLVAYSIYVCFRNLGQTAEANDWKNKAIALKPELVNAPDPPIFLPPGN